MSIAYSIRKGLDIKLIGDAEKTVADLKSRLFAVKPTDFIGCFPKMSVKEGDEVKAGSLLFFDKYREDIYFTSPVSGKITFWYGGRSLKELFYVEQFEKIQQKNPNFNFEVALSEPLQEDKWKGKTGFIHQVIFDSYLKDHPEPEEIEYYLCGPPMMIGAVLKMLDDLGVPEEMIMFDDFGS